VGGGQDDAVDRTQRRVPEDAREDLARLEQRAQLRLGGGPGTVEDLAQRLPDDGGTAAGRATYLLLDGVDRGEVALHGFRDDRPGQAQVGRLPAEVHGRP